MIAAVAFCPNPPLLIPTVAQGAAPELDDLRAACRAAITRIAASGKRIVVIGSGPATSAHPATARGTFAGFGVPLEVSLGSDEPGPLELPLSLTVGAWLLRDALGSNNGATGFSVHDDVPVLDDCALLVMGDGSARRSTAAPGYLDDRAAAFDAEVVAALRSGTGGALARLDNALGTELLAAGLPAWRAAGALLTGTYDAEVHYDAAPYGVGYFVAIWTTATWTT
jgi:hypothetical protein